MGDTARDARAAAGVPGGDSRWAVSRSGIQLRRTASPFHLQCWVDGSTPGQGIPPDGRHRDGRDGRTAVWDSLWGTGGAWWLHRRMEGIRWTAAVQCTGPRPPAPPVWCWIHGPERTTLRCWWCGGTVRCWNSCLYHRQVCNDPILHSLWQHADTLAGRPAPFLCLWRSPCLCCPPARMTKRSRGPGKGHMR